MFIKNLVPGFTALLLVSSARAADSTCAANTLDCITNSTPKSGLSPPCAYYGKPTRAMDLSSCTASTFEDCRDVCLNEKSCESFGYTSANASCALSDRGLRKLDFKRVKFNFGSVYSNRNCFTRMCFEPCVQGTVRSQMVKNPSFSNRVAPFMHWRAVSSGKHQPETGTRFAPNNEPVAYWISNGKDESGVSATISQRLKRTVTGAERFQFSAWIGQYGYEPYPPMSVTVKVDGIEIFSAQQICTVDTACQSFGDDAIFRQISAFGTMSSANPLLEIVFAPTAIQQYQIAYLNGVSVATNQCVVDQ